ncbi:MAG: glycosyltransferase N-terminal domain-containing protein [Bacteroidales bacterium]|nr:glycosyltransferase N-terminal domain-containing protein [Bacteroidales bacterium]
MRPLYTFFIHAYSWMIAIAALWNTKARQWKSGRKNWYQNLSQQIPNDKKIVWFHCASLGEFDQGLPVMESLKENQPNIFLVVTFFSPSGYEHRKKHSVADLICYIPIDTPKNVQLFLQVVHPEYAVFVKYEFWYNFLHQLHINRIPVIFIASNFRSSQPFFQWYGGWFRKHLQQVTAFFVQNENSKKLLESIKIEQVTVCGDTRFDRVADLVAQNYDLPIIQAFKNDGFLLVAGSSWPPEEEILQQLLQQKWPSLKLIIAPHDISETHIQQIEKRFPNHCLRYTQADEHNISDKNILIINNIGILNKIYRYADVAFIGGGFGSGLHNILEAACYGVPVFYGPKTEKFPEARLLQEAGSGFPINSYQEFNRQFRLLFDQQKYLQETKQLSFNFVQQRKGATKTILQYLLHQ